MANIGMIGAGSWGTALTFELTSKGHDVSVWTISQDEVDMINNEHQQRVKLPGVMLPERVHASTDLEKTIEGKDLLVLAVPSPFTRSTARAMAPFVQKDQLTDADYPSGNPAVQNRGPVRSDACRRGR